MGHVPLEKCWPTNPYNHGSFSINIKFDEFGAFLLVELVYIKRAIYIYDWMTNKNVPNS